MVWNLSKQNDYVICTCFTKAVVKNSFFKFYIFYYFSLCWVFVAACGLSLVVGQVCSLIAVYRRLTAVGSLVVEHGL